MIAAVQIIPSKGFIRASLAVVAHAPLIATLMLILYRHDRTVRADRKAYQQRMDDDRPLRCHPRIL